MEIGETLYVSDRKPWRAWLEANFDTAKEIWLVYPNKASGERRIVYNDAVEEALCFDWIDSIIKNSTHCTPFSASRRGRPRAATRSRTRSGFAGSPMRGCSTRRCANRSWTY